MWLIRLTWVCTGLVPQTTIRSECVGDLGRRHAPAPPVPGLEADVGEHDADRALEARVALGVGQALDAVALHEAHRAGVPVGPDGLAPVPLLGAQEALGDLVERVLPADPLELAGALGALAAQRPGRGARDDGSARDSGRPWRRSRPRCSALRSLPRTLPSRPSGRFSTSSAQTLGQSCGQTEGWNSLIGRASGQVTPLS